MFTQRAVPPALPTLGRVFTRVVRLGEGKIAAPVQTWSRIWRIPCKLLNSNKKSDAAGGALYKRAMANEVFGKHMVWTVDPRTQAEIGIGYSTLAEAQAEAVKLENVGYKILRITPTSLPKPNS
jgi:hypothetical protein